MPLDRLSLNSLGGELGVFFELLGRGMPDLIRRLTNPSARPARSDRLLIHLQLHRQPPLGGIRLEREIRIVVELRIGGGAGRWRWTVESLVIDARLQRLEFVGELFEELFDFAFQGVLSALIHGGLSAAHLCPWRGSSRHLLTFGAALLG